MYAAFFNRVCYYGKNKQNGGLGYVLVNLNQLNSGKQQDPQPTPNQLREIMWADCWVGDFEESPYLKHTGINQRY